MSLARAFKYTGCPNIMMSLWQADDDVTKQIMESFYQNLEDGMAKPEAIRMAKLDYLMSGKKLHPHFWAPFILIGDGQPIDFATAGLLSKWWLWAALGAVLLMAMIPVYRRFVA